MKKNWVIKSISIEVEDAKIADRVGNLSKFVRVCLRRWAAFEEQQGQHKTPGVLDRLGVCLPSSNCIVCWPNGVPSEHAFALYKGVDPASLNETTMSLAGQINNPTIPYTGPEVMNLDWLRRQVPEMFEISQIDAKGNEPAIRTKKKAKRRSIISRMLNILQK